jgi:signal transduction histidine kinase
MSAEEVAKIFDPFQQANDQTARRFGGTGLGLSITKAYSELLHGSLTVESVPGKGTSFTMTLPLIPPQESAKLAAARPERREAAGTGI